MKKADNPRKANELLQKYLKGESSAEDEQKILRWYFSFTRKDELPVTPQEQNEVLRSAKANILAAVREKPVKKISRINYTYLKVAAMLFMLSSVSFFYFRYFKQNTDVFATDQLVSTKAGERKMIVLADGTKVWLNNASVLHYPSKFGSQSRTVKLDGEAFFEVRHQSRPFLIYTKDLKVQVLGTSFNVKAYRADKKSSVNVSTGKVSVSNQQHSIMLIKGEGMTYTHSANEFAKISGSKVTQSNVWKENTLYFRYETLEDISLRLERWYGVKFIIQNKSLLQKRYTLEQHNETLDNVMKALSAGEFNYKLENQSVIVW